jgi:hypothetical protein
MRLKMGGYAYMSPVLYSDDDEEAERVISYGHGYKSFLDPSK